MGVQQRHRAVNVLRVQRGYVGADHDRLGARTAVGSPARERVVERASHAFAEVAAASLGFEPDVRPRRGARVQRARTALALEPATDAVLLAALREEHGARRYSLASGRDSEDALSHARVKLRRVRVAHVLREPRLGLARDGQAREDDQRGGVRRHGAKHYCDEELSQSFSCRKGC